MAGVINMTSNVEKRRIREQNNIPNRNSTRTVKNLGYGSMAEFYRDVLRREQRQNRTQEVIRTGLLQARDRARDRVYNRRVADDRNTLFESIRSIRTGGVFDVPRGLWNLNAGDTHRNLLSRFRGRKATVTTTIYGPRGPAHVTVNVKIPSDFNKWFKKIGWWQFMADSKTSKISELAEEMGLRIKSLTRVTITVTPHVVVNPSQTTQKFADGVNHCVLTPILDWSKIKNENAKSDSACKKYNAIGRKCSEYSERYKDGIPENCIQEICNDLQVGINIEIPFADDKFIECIPHKKSLKNFNFVNSKMDHVELDEVVHTNKINEINQESLNKMALKLKDDSKLLDFKWDGKDNYIKIRTIFGTYCSPSDYLKVASEFENKYLLGDVKIDAINDPCYRFIREGVCHNTTIDFIGSDKIAYLGDCENKYQKKKREQREYDDYTKWDREVPPKPEIGQIDMIKAYAKYRDCEQFSGFMGKPTDWRFCDVDIEFIKKNIGYYRLASISNGTELAKKIKKKMKLYNVGEVLATPEYVWLEQNGFEFTVSEGCWGIKTDFRFTKDMYTKERKTSFYSKWCGINQSCEPRQKYNMFGTPEYFENMKTHVSEQCEMSWVTSEKDMVEISYPKNQSFICPHIVGFLMCYQRLTVLNQLKKMDLSKLIRICVDGIYYYEHEFEMLKNFQPDKEINLGNTTGSSNYYMRRNSWICYWDMYKPGMKMDLESCLANRIQPAPFRENYDTELFIGAGGNGKTHYNLVDTGFIRPLYVAPAYKLTRNKELEYNVNTKVLARCFHPTYKHDIKKYNNVIIFDEASQINRDTKIELFEFYGDSCKLIFCGDLGFQLPPIIGEEMGTRGFQKVTEFTQNFRFTCDKHKQICEDVRELMRNDTKKEQINEFVISQYENISEPTNYKPHDIILCSRTNCGGGVCKQETKKRSNCNCDGKNFSLVWTNKFGNTKWKCLETSSSCSNGDVIIAAEKPKGRWEARHGYTIHSVQGETYEETIYIDSRQLFDSRMAYTAISRARRWEQIKIIV